MRICIWSEQAQIYTRVNVLVFAHVKIDLVTETIISSLPYIHGGYAWGRDAWLWNLVYRDWSTGKWMTQVVISKIYLYI